MSSKTTLNQLFGALHSELKSDLGIARETIGHPSAKGAVSENAWLKMLNRHLPTRYRANKAFVIDSQDSCSDENDIVIHDRQYSPFVLNKEGAMYVPAESVYAVLEVKQDLNAKHVAYAAGKIASVRKLYRTSLPIPYAAGEHPAKALHHILGGLVILTCDWKKPFGKPFEKAICSQAAAGHLDIGCAVCHGVFEVKYAANKPPVITAERSAASLALFLMRFIARLQSIATVPRIDVLAYAANMKTENAE